MEHTDADDYRPDELRGKEAGAKSLCDAEAAETSGPGKGKGAVKGGGGLAIEQQAIAGYSIKEALKTSACLSVKLGPAQAAILQRVLSSVERILPALPKDVIK